MLCVSDVSMFGHVYCVFFFVSMCLLCMPILELMVTMHSTCL